MFANVTKDGLEITAHNSLASTWITAQVTRFLLYIMNENFSLELQPLSKKGLLICLFFFLNEKGKF